MDVSQGSGIVKVDQTAPSSYPFTYTFESGTSVNLWALPDVGCQFTGWSGDLSGTTNPATILMNCDKRISAGFSPAAPPKTGEALVGGITSGIILLGLLLAVWINKRRA